MARDRSLTWYARSSRLCQSERVAITTDAHLTHQMSAFEPRLSVSEFCSLHVPALERDEVRHNIMLAVLGGLSDRQSSDVMTWSLGAPGQCAIMCPGRPILLADVSEAQCQSLAEQTAELNYLGVVGPERTAPWFAKRAEELGLKFLEPIPQRLHALPASQDIQAVPEVPGE